MKGAQLHITRWSLVTDEPRFFFTLWVMNLWDSLPQRVENARHQLHNTDRYTIFFNRGFKFGGKPMRSRGQCKSVMGIIKWCGMLEGVSSLPLLLFSYALVIQSVTQDISIANKNAGTSIKSVDYRVKHVSCSENMHLQNGTSLKAHYSSSLLNVHCQELSPN